MSTNKNAIIRYQALDRCLSNFGNHYDIEDLTRICNDALLEFNPDMEGVSKRTIYKDINSMQDPLIYDAPIERYRDDRKVYFRYSDANFSINKQLINGQEAEQLKEVMLTLSRFKGMPQFEWLEEMQKRLEKTFNLSSNAEVIVFESNPYLIGLEHIDILYNAIVHKIVLDIRWHSYRSGEQSATIHPYFLKQYNNRWYLLGQHSEFEKIWHISLDRIDRITKIKTAYINTEIDIEDYFGDVIGMTIPDDAKPEKILLKVSDTSLPYIVSKPLHGSQRKPKINNIIELNLIINYELEAQILSFGSNIEVLEPLWLRNKIKKEINKLLLKYH